MDLEKLLKELAGRATQFLAEWQEPFRHTSNLFSMRLTGLLYLSASYGNGSDLEEKLEAVYRVINSEMGDIMVNHTRLEQQEETDVDSNDASNQGGT